MSRHVTAGGRLPGDPDRETLIARMIRVDQAGEYGAARMYCGIDPLALPRCQRLT